MMGIAENLRNAVSEERILECNAFPRTIGKECRSFDSCKECSKAVLNGIADAIEAELADAIGEAKREAMAKAVGSAIVNNLYGKHESQLPEGIEWPRFEDGELVKFGDRYSEWGKIPVGHEDTVSSIHFKTSGFRLNGTRDKYTYNYGEPVQRPEPEVLDADGVPIKVGDTVYGVESGREVKVMNITADIQYSISTEDARGLKWRYEPKSITHRKPDTQEAIDADAEKDPCDYFGMMGKTCGSCDVFEKFNNGYISDVCYSEQTKDLLRRQRKLMGGE